MRYLLCLFFLITSAYANLSPDDLIFENLPKSKEYDIKIGTGFFVNNYMIITNSHIVDNCLCITIRSADEKPQKVSLFATDQNLDLALLKTSNYNQTAKKLLLSRSQKSLQINDPIFVDLFSSVSENENILEKTTITKIDDSFFYFSGKNMTSGNSGSPIFDSNMDIIGLLVAKVEIFDFKGNLSLVTNQALHINRIEKFIKSNNIPIFYQKSKQNFLPNSQIQDRPDLIKIHCVKQSNITE